MIKFKSKTLFAFIMIASFFNSFMLQQFFLLLSTVNYFYKKRVVRLDLSIKFLLLFILSSFLSYFYNFHINSIDQYTIVFWMIGYVPPILLAIIVYSYRLDFKYVWKVFIVLILLQVLVLTIQAIEHKVFLLRDFATGTVGDANFISFYLYLVVFYIISKKMYRYSYSNFKSRVYEYLAIIILFTYTLMAESSAMTGLFLLIIIFLVLKIIKNYFSKLSYKRIFLFFGIFFILIFGTINFIKDQSKTGGSISRINSLFTLIEKNTFEELIDNPFVYKIKSYYLILSGKIYEDVNFLVGSGPSTYTSRTSFVRIPDLRTNLPPIKVPSYESPIVKKYLRYEEEVLKTASYGNLATPKTTIISVIVETGFVGFVLFSLFFITIFRQLSKLQKVDQMNSYVYFFGKLVTIYFVMLLFYINIWEYHLITFVYVILIFSILNIPRTQERLNESFIHNSNI
jgi:hypothetical protein